MVPPLIKPINMINVRLDLGHNWLSCVVLLVKVQALELPLAQTIRPNWQSLLASGSVGIQTWSIYKRKSIPEETRTITVPSLIITQLFFCIFEEIKF